MWWIVTLLCLWTSSSTLHVYTSAVLFFYNMHSFRRKISPVRSFRSFLWYFSHWSSFQNVYISNASILFAIVHVLHPYSIMLQTFVFSRFFQIYVFQDKDSFFFFFWLNATLVRHISLIISFLYYPSGPIVFCKYLKSSARSISFYYRSYIMFTVTD